MSWTIMAVVLTLAIIALAALGLMNPLFSVALKGLLSAAVLALFAWILFKRKRSLDRQHAMQRAYANQHKTQYNNVTHTTREQ